MDVTELPARFYDRAMQLKLASITVQLSGGSDEAYIHVHASVDVSFLSRFDPHEERAWWRLESLLLADIEGWIENHFDYSGAGDGTEYGDEVTYDFVEQEVITSAWYMSPVDTESEFIGGDLKIGGQPNDSI